MSSKVADVADWMELRISTQQRGSSGVRTNRIMMVGAILESVSICWAYNHFITADDVLTFCSAFSKLSAIAGNEQLKQVPGTKDTAGSEE